MPSMFELRQAEQRQADINPSGVNAWESVLDPRPSPPTSVSPPSAPAYAPVSRPTPTPTPSPPSASKPRKAGTPPPVVPTRTPTPEPQALPLRLKEPTPPPAYVMPSSSPYAMPPTASEVQPSERVPVPELEPLPWGPQYSEAPATPPSGQVVVPESQWRDPHDWWSPRQDPTEAPGTPPDGYQWVPSESRYPTGEAHFFWSLEPVQGGTGQPPAAQVPRETEGTTGGGGGGGGGPTTPPVEMLGELAWWPNADTLQPLLRAWGGWLRELVEENRLVRAVPNPFMFDAEAEAAAAAVGEGAQWAQREDAGDRPKQEANLPPLPGYRTTTDVMKRIKELLGVEFAAGETQTSQWQKVINAIPQADFEAQQLLASLRFNPSTDQWYTVDIGQLVNPRYT